MKPTTKPQAEVYVILQNMQLKIWVTIILLVIFVLLTVALVLMMTGVFPSAWESQAILGGIDGILAISVSPMIKHFFPNYFKAKDIEGNGTR